MVKNEEDIIERFFRVNSKVLDRFVIYDDNSSDSTVDIIKKVIAENKIRITLVQNNPLWSVDQLCNRQETVMHGLRKFVVDDKEGCDFIFPIDADEYIFEDRQSVCNKLQTFSSCYGANAYGGIKWKTFVPVNGELTADKTLKSVFSPMQRETDKVYKAVIPFHLSLCDKLCMGNHNLVNNNNQVDLCIPLCHFPVRSVNQILTKALIADYKYSMKKNRGKSEGYHISKLAKLIRDKNFNIDASDLVDITFNFLRRDNYPQNHIYSSYEPFSRFVEDNLCYTPDTGTRSLTRSLDGFILDLCSQMCK
jgi:glycosyltransferase involved in cell wall biosynthesis